jgi:PAS domain S-box-containing protein
MVDLSLGLRAGLSEAALSDEKAKDLLRVLDLSSIVAFTDRAGNITYANDRFCEISQFAREELIGKNHRIINSGLHSPDFWHDFWETISSGKVWKGEIRNRAKDGSHYWLFTTIIPLMEESGQPRQYISIRYEITDQKKTELEKDQAQLEVEKMKLGQELGERFVSMLAHDLRTPLTSAKLSAELILRRIDSPDKIVGYANKVIQGLERAEGMISHLLDSSRVRAGEVITVESMECDLASEVRLTLEDLKIVYGDRFIYNVRGNFRGVWDRLGFRRVTENLCSNAIKYGSPKRPILVDLSDEDSQIAFSVHNEGVPISEAEQQNIFRYRHRTASAKSTDTEGWGIGLSKVREVAEANGGTVEVRSSVDAGTNFTFRLPKKSPVLKVEKSY